MKNKAERRTRLGEIMAERGCKERQAMRVLAAEEAGEAIPGTAFGPPVIGQEETTKVIIQSYLDRVIDTQEARSVIGKRGVSLRTLRRRVEEFKAEAAKSAHAKSARYAKLALRAEKARARGAVTTAIRNGSLTVGRCARCGLAASLKGNPQVIQAHHHKGYEKTYWLDVTWLCRPCHSKAHRCKGASSE